MDFDEISWLRKNSPAWRLLCADHAPLMLSFFATVFVDGNVRSISATDLISGLDDELYALNERLAGTGSGVAFPKPAKAYLEDWAAPAAGWLRKYYPDGSDEPHFDATPAVEKAIQFVTGLRSRSFVGTESRLNTIVLLLREMAFGAEADPQARLAELTRQRQALDEEIARVAAGDFELLDPAAQRDRYQQFSATARELLADFREVEENFRQLDRRLRERIAGWSGPKGELLDEVLGNREAIAGSDQGKSFQAFYDFLLSASRQEELSRLLERVHDLEAIAGAAGADQRLRHIHFDWLDAGERTQATVRQLSEQLRRFLDDQVWFENRRVMDILRSIESLALTLRDEKVTATMTLDAAAPAVVLPMERPLYLPVRKAVIDSDSVLPADDDPDATSLFEQVYVDAERLATGVRQSLRSRSQVGLADVLADEPLTQGLAELVTYLSLTDELFRVVFDDSASDQVTWSDDDGRTRSATLPRVTFARIGTQAPSSAREVRR